MGSSAVAMMEHRYGIDGATLEINAELLRYSLSKIALYFSEI